MEDNRLSNQALDWFPAMRRKSPRKRWRDTMISDLKAIDLTWDEAAQLALDRHARGRTKV